MLMDLSPLFNWDDKFYNFSRATKDLYPYRILKDEGKTTIVHNVVGIKEVDLNVSIKDSYLILSGVTKNKVLGTDFSVNSRFQINPQKIEKISWAAADGLIYIYIYHKKVKQPQIQVSKVGAIT